LTEKTLRSINFSYSTPPPEGARNDNLINLFLLFKEMNILLIGCGRTGRAIVENLIELNNVNNLFLYSRTPKSSKALARDLDNRKVQVVEKISDLNDIDYVIISLSGMSDSARTESMNKRDTTYEVRQDELKFNLGAIAQLIKDLANLNAKIIVVTNPVDEITNSLRIMLKNKIVLGFGLELDAKRYESELGKRVMCIGSHGRAIPIINAKSEEVYTKLLHKIDSALLNFIRKHGIPHKLAGLSFRTFFEKLNSNSEQIVHMSYYLSKPFLGIRDISISLPFRVKKGKILGIANLDVNEIEKKRFISSANELRESVNHILETHKKLMEYK